MAVIEELSHAECLELLQFASFVGRIGFVLDGKPMVLPVNYIATPDSIVFCSAPGSKLAAITSSEIVAFETDDSRALEHSGWSILVHGKAAHMTDNDEIETYRRGPLQSWGTSHPQHWIKISIDSITGRRIPAG